MSTDKYETKLELPTFYVKKAEQQAFRLIQQLH